MGRLVSVFLLLLLLLLPLPLPVSARPVADPPTAPCYAAALAALTRQGALYSQGGVLSDDPIDPTGGYYSRLGPDSFDCSGLVWWSYAQAGVSVGMTTYQQLNDGVAIPCSLADLNGATTPCWALGDLVFLRYTGGQHVAIYVGHGLFMDCYNHAVGCIVHDVRDDAFYQSHFYQARRIVTGCGGISYDPGTPTAPIDTPVGELLPDLLGYVSFVVPQCGVCAGDDDIVPLHPQEPPPFDWNPLYPFRWLATMLQNLVVTLLCWLLTLLQIIATFASRAVNSLMYLLNALARVIILIWLALRGWLIAVWGGLDDLRSIASTIQAAASMVQAWLAVIYELLLLMQQLVVQAAVTLVQIGFVVLALLGFMGGLVLALIGQVLTALGSSTTPPQLVADNHIIYHMTRGALEGFRDSWAGWLLIIADGLIYVGFLYWVARFLSSSGDAE